MLGAPSIVLQVGLTLFLPRFHPATAYGKLAAALMDRLPCDNPEGRLIVPLLYPGRHTPCQVQSAVHLRHSKDRGGTMCPGHGGRF